METQNIKIDTISRRTALGIMIPLALAALVLAGAVISIANDMYAFVKPNEEIVFSITNISTDTELSQQLREHNIIKNDIVFTLYLRSKGRSDDINLLSGQWTLNSSMSYRQICAALF